MLSKRSSGLDFSDGKYAIDPLQQHPDMAMAYNAGPQPSHLQRNKSERTRLQGLQRSNTIGSNAGQALNHSRTFRQKFGIWMINEGGRQLFFGIWVFLHLLVAVFGMFHYQLKDNLVTARATFGITFCTPPSTWIRTIVKSLICSDRPRCSSGLARRCHLYPSPCLPQLHLVPSPDSSQRHHSVWQEHHFPYSDGMVYRYWFCCTHRCAHGKFCKTGECWPWCQDHWTKIFGFPCCQLHHGTRNHWLDYDCSIGNNGFFRHWETPSCPFWAILVLPSSVHRLLHQLAASRYVLHDQAWPSSILFIQHYWSVLGEFSIIWIFLKMGYWQGHPTEVLACWRCHLDFWAYPAWNSISPLYLYLQSCPASFKCHGASD